MVAPPTLQCITGEHYLKWLFKCRCDTCYLILNVFSMFITFCSSYCSFNMLQSMVFGNVGLFKENNVLRCNGHGKGSLAILTGVNGSGKSLANQCIQTCLDSKLPLYEYMTIPHTTRPSYVISWFLLDPVVVKNILSDENLTSDDNLKAFVDEFEKVNVEVTCVSGILAEENKGRKYKFLEIARSENILKLILRDDQRCDVICKNGDINNEKSTLHGVLSALEKKGQGSIDEEMKNLKAHIQTNTEDLETTKLPKLLQFTRKLLTRPTLSQKLLMILKLPWKLLMRITLVQKIWKMIWKLLQGNTGSKQEMFSKILTELFGRDGGVVFMYPQRGIGARMGSYSAANHKEDIHKEVVRNAELLFTYWDKKRKDEYMEERYQRIMNELVPGCSYSLYYDDAKGEYTVKDSEASDIGNVSILYMPEGIFEAMLFSLCLAIHKQDYVTICYDEPTRCMHETMVNAMRTVITEFVKDNKVCFIFTTHSPNFVTQETWYSVTHFQRLGNKNVVLRCQSLQDEKFNIKDLKYYCKFRTFLFSKQILLVEGISDKIFIEALLHYLQSGKHLKKSPQKETEGKPVNFRNIQVLDVGGTNNMEKERKLCMSLNIPYRELHDRDVFEDHNDLRTGLEQILIEAELEDFIEFTEAERNCFNQIWGAAMRFLNSAYLDSKTLNSDTETLDSQTLQYKAKYGNILNTENQSNLEVAQKILNTKKTSLCDKCTEEGLRDEIANEIDQILKAIKILKKERKQNREIEVKLTEEKTEDREKKEKITKEREENPEVKLTKSEVNSIQELHKLESSWPGWKLPEAKKRINKAVKLIQDFMNDQTTEDGKTFSERVKDVSEELREVNEQICTWENKILKTQNLKNMINSPENVQFEDLKDILATLVALGRIFYWKSNDLEKVINACSTRLGEPLIKTDKRHIWYLDKNVKNHGNIQNFTTSQLKELVGFILDDQTEEILDDQTEEILDDQTEEILDDQTEEIKEFVEFLTLFATEQ